tara:strand:+ start:353 stop:1846 length:1494 start_codon:yes stop_codon:yes gene_type:complete
LLIKNQNKKFIKNFNPCLGGVLGGISISTHFWLIFMPISLFILWSGSDKRIHNFCWGFFFILVSHSWLYDLHPLTWLGFSWITSLMITISILFFCSVLGGILVSLWGLMGEIILFKEDIFKINTLNLIVKVFLLSSLWGMGELILSQTPFFWIGLGEGLVPGNMYLAGLASWIGASGLSVVQIMIGFWIYFIYGKLRQKTQFIKPFVLGLLIIFLLHVFGGLIKPINSNFDYPIAIWQTNIPTREKINFNDEFIKGKLFAAQKYALSNKAKLLIAPEGTLNTNFNLVTGSEINMLAGGFRNSKNELRSSLLGYEIGDKNFTSFIDKSRLVPLGEKTPGFLNIFSRGLSSVGGVQPGADSRFFNSKFAPPMAVAICYEISDGLKIRNAIKSDAKLIISLSNLDPYPKKLQNQFLSLARIRSIENKRDNVLVSNTGPSGLISYDGKINKILNSNTEQTQIVFPNFSSKKTFYTRFGEQPLMLLFIFCIGLNLFLGKLTN